MANCELCDAKLSSSILWGSLRVSPEDLEGFRGNGGSAPDDICYQCFEGLVKELPPPAPQLSPLEDNERRLVELLSEIRLTTYAPGHDETYEHCGLVTATAAIGTGPVSQLISAVTDFFGQESGVYNEKLQQGETLCLMRVRRRAAFLNANAVAGAQMTYSELTAGQGMVLAAMTGTAIRLAEGPQDIQERYRALMQEREGLEAE